VIRVFADTQMRRPTWQTVAKGYTRDQVQEWIAAALRECADHGKKYGVRIGVQNHGDFLQTGPELLGLVKAVGSDWCGPIVDLPIETLSPRGKPYDPYVVVPEFLKQLREAMATVIPLPSAAPARQ
jgi:sugar phosphate isomerase/epimerase